MKASYPVILTPAGRGYVVFVPNLNINTEGGTLAEALDMARDAISIWGITEQDAGRTIPEASDTMPTAVGGQIVRRVEVDFEAYRRGATAYPACFYKENTHHPAEQINRGSTFQLGRYAQRRRMIATACPIISSG